jgi:hypothetical protein
MQQVDSIEAGSAIGFERAWWRFENVLYLLITLLLIAAVAGFTGRGPVSQAIAGVPGSAVWAEYEKYARFRTPSMLAVHLGPDALHGAQAVVRLTGSIVDRVPISRISPQPQTVAPIPNGQQFTFPVAQPGDSATVRFVVEPAKPGLSQGTLATPGAPPITFSQFIYP